MDASRMWHWPVRWTSLRRQCSTACGASNAPGPYAATVPSSIPRRSGSPFAPSWSPGSESTAKSRSRRSRKASERLKGLRACYQVTGQFDMLIELALRDLEDLSQLIRVDIARIPGVMNLETMLIMVQSVAEEGWPTRPRTVRRRRAAGARRHSVPREKRTCRRKASSSFSR